MYLDKHHHILLVLIALLLQEHVIKPKEELLSPCAQNALLMVISLNPCPPGMFSVTSWVVCLADIMPVILSSAPTQ